MTRVARYHRRDGRSAAPRRDRRPAHPPGRCLARRWRWAHRACRGICSAHPFARTAGARRSGRGRGWTVDSRVLWCAALFHDIGLTSIASNTMCFEVEGAELARRTLERFGMEAEAADRAAIAIILHMQPGRDTRRRRRGGAARPRRRRSTSRVDVDSCERVRGGHTQVPARGVRSPLPAGDPTGERSPRRLPERPAPAQDRPRRMDGALAVAGATSV